MIDTVLSVSARTNLSFIGHSMGTTAFLILASTRPDRVRPVSRAVFLAPVVEPHNMRNLVGRLSYLHRFYRWAVETIQVLEILPSSMLIEKLTWDHLVHHGLRFSLFGRTRADKKDNMMLARICHHAKSSKTSIYTILHYAQNIASKVFNAYNWEDKTENVKRYGSENPPIYDLSQVDTETVLFWSPNDSLSSQEDMERLVKELPNLQPVGRSLWAILTISGVPISKMISTTILWSSSLKAKTDLLNTYRSS